MTQRKFAKVRRVFKRPMSECERQRLKVLISMGTICSIFRVGVEEFWI